MKVLNQIIDDNHKLNKVVEKNPDLEPKHILKTVEYNSHILNRMIKDLGKKENEITKTLEKLIKKLSKVQLIKQRLLLLSVTAQLASLLFLLILFRNISLNVKQK